MEDLSISAGTYVKWRIGQGMRMEVLSIRVEAGEKQRKSGMSEERQGEERQGGVGLKDPEQKHEQGSRRLSSSTVPIQHCCVSERRASSGSQENKEKRQSKPQPEKWP